MQLISFSGKAQHGKDTCARIAAKIAKDEFGANIGSWALAHPLKAVVYGEGRGVLTFEDVWYNKPAQVRKMLQIRGTEEGRNKFGENFWTLQSAAYLRLFAESMPFMDAVSLTDVRFPNEVMMVRLGGRVADVVLSEIRQQVCEDFNFTPEDEEQLLFSQDSEDLANLLRLEAAVAGAIDVRYAYELANSGSFALYIQSNRPTLTGEAALHPSETALDEIDKATLFDGIIINNVDTSFAKQGLTHEAEH
jgi:hypothetical protein